MVRAKAAFLRAQRHFSAGHFDRALGAYAEAYAIKPLAAFLFNIAQCHFNRQRFDEAVVYYRKYLAEAPNATNRALTEELIAKAERRSSPGGKSAPAAKTSDAGKTPVNGGARPSSKDPLRGGQSATDGGTGVGDRGGRDAPGAPKTPSWQDPLFLTGAGTSAALLLVGIVSGIATLSKKSEFSDPGTSAARQRELQDSGRSLGAVSGGMFLGSALVGLGTVAYYYFVLRQPEQARSVKAARWPSISIALDAQVGLAWRF